MIKKKSQNLSPAKAEILGLLCAEGSYYKYLTVYNEFFKNRGRYYTIIKNVEAIEFTNLNDTLLQHFRELMLSVYDYAPKPTGVKTSMKIRIKKKSVIKDLLKYSDFGCMKWRVPKEFFNSHVAIKASFIRGLFDGDGSINNNYIRLVSINKIGITGVKKLLKSINIESRLRGPRPIRGNRRPQYVLSLTKPNVLIYKKKVSSKHNTKLEKLRMLR